MLRTLRRSPAVAAILALCLVVGPSASALCAHGSEAHDAAPTHEGGAAPFHEGTESPAPPSDSHGDECASACCLRAVETPTLTPAPPVPPLVATLAVGVEEVRPAPALAVSMVPAARPAPPRLYLETGGLRV